MFLVEADSFPRPLNRCIGRQGEVVELKKLMLEHRLVTVTGPGGIGKTRLALEIAQALESQLEVSFISLGPILTGQSLLGALGQALGLADGEAPGFLQRLRQLCPGRWLCILDSFEHLLPQAPLLTQMLNQIPQMQLLITSRSTLRIGGEQVFPLQPLAVSLDQHGEAKALVASEELFLERARAIRPDFQLQPGQEATLSQICRALEGLPLALELAASRLELLTLEELNSRLSQKLQLLEEGPLDAAPRHRTIRATIDWSYDLLEKADQLVFRRLSVFTGGFRLEHVGALGAPKAEEAVTRLLRHNLLRRRESGDGNTRLFFMDVIREYAQEQLSLSGEEKEVRQAFCRLNLQLAQQARQAFGGEGQARAFRELAEEHENLSACLSYWRSAQEPGIGQLVSALGWYWESSGHLAQGLGWARQALDSFAKGDARRLGPLEVAGTLARHQGNYAMAEEYYGEALELAEADHAPALLAHLAETDYRRGLYREASQRYLKSFQDARQAGEGENKEAVAAQIGLGRSLWALGQSEEGRQSLQASLDASLRGNFLRLTGWCHNALGEVARSHREWPIATEHFLAGAAVFEQLDDRGPRAILLQNLAFVRLAQEQWEAAAQGLRQAFEHWFRCGSQHGLALSLIGLARLAEQRKDDTGARQLGRLAQTILEELNCPLDPSDRLELEALHKLLQNSHPEPAKLALDELLTERIKKLTAPPPAATPKAPSSSPLTGREHQVVHLLAQGLSNLAIAEQLHISRHTVTVHLRTIYDKLGVHSRSAATRWALDQDRL